MIKSVFLAYPADKSYASAYSFPIISRLIKWKPWICGIIRQDGKWIAMFAISASDSDFLDNSNNEKLRKLVSTLERLRVALDAEFKTFAGTLPGILFSKRIVKEALEADLTASVVHQAIMKTLVEEFLSKKTPIVLLGGKGFIGRKVKKLLDGREVYDVDIADSTFNWPFHLEGQRILIVNITRSGALNAYVELMWQGCVVLNEVYPEPSSDVLERMRVIGCHCYHIAGVKAKAIPVFPGAYASAAPCCAAWPSDKIAAEIVRLV